MVRQLALQAITIILILDLHEVPYTLLFAVVFSLTYLITKFGTPSESQTH